MSTTPIDALKSKADISTADVQSAPPAPAATPEDNIEAAILALGGIKVRGATPKLAAEPDPNAFAEVGGKFVGKIPAMPPAKD
jgi:hypothetical protein